MKQAFYVLTDFLEDPDFIRWVKHPDETQDAYWQQFLDAHPDKKPVVEMARQYILVFVEQTGQQQPTAAQSEMMRQYIQKHVQAEKEEKVTTPFTRTTGTTWGWLRMAASITLVISIGLGAYWYSQTQMVQPESYQQFKKANLAGTKEARNDTDKPLTVLLSDGSSVVLQPGSRLSYPDTFQQREVYLTGKAFFEIVKDPARPFLVYTHGIATKVLGTSFMVDAPESGEPIKVAVKTGRVAVYALDESASVRKKAADPELEGLVLTPNQSAEYSVESRRLVRMPDSGWVFTQPETQVVARQSFDFDETPVPEVFRTLEKAYGVHIVYDETMLGKCSLSASLMGQPFHDKLAVVCKALEAQYAIQGNQVTITGGQRCQ
ncbi:DUF4974 domain-containing protein [Spirosoma sp. HMF4905]|uniref:DUF4974 domain-containing protein n=1 Tax=Spirosoma arboris TaxID=2682092 RepID=A0A7K1S5T1_9BACT|nr:FecR family protein [Spirosoma arboris]MVM28978.1 DUF4974 domain-containing protein [Spirosoma arboris]